MLRVCKKPSPSTEETHSYPYRALSCWHWQGGPDEEEMRIEAGSDLVTVKGRGLDRLVEALDRNSLELLREVSSNSDISEGIGIQIVSINVDVLKIAE